LLDADQEERERGITINTQTVNFSTPSRDFCVIDCPGHADFLPNMIRGASQAECGILVLDSHGSGFESGMKLQTKEHAILARAMGVTQLVCAINKLDRSNWKEEVYDNIC
jgi:elongation factor 1 alpha-like protein